MLHACTQLQPCLHCRHSSSTCCRNVSLVCDTDPHKLHGSRPRARLQVVAACSVGRSHRTVLLHLSVNVPAFLPLSQKEAGMDDAQCHKPQGSSCLVLRDELQYKTQYRNTTYYMSRCAIINRREIKHRHEFNLQSVSVMLTGLIIYTSLQGPTDNTSLNTTVNDTFQF